MGLELAATAGPGSTVADLQGDLTTGQQQGAAVLPLAHAAQALAWLGY